MLVLDSGFAYEIFGLNIQALFALVKIVVTLVVIFFTVRIPLKRRYHWMFLVLGFAFLYFSSVSFYNQIAPDAATSAARLLWIYLDSNRLLALLFFQFVVYFVSPNPTKWMKYALVGGYAYVAATNWAPFFFDPSFVITKGVKTATAYAAGPGASDAYLKPYGIDLFVTLMAILTVYLLYRLFRYEKSPLVRGQTKYLIVGLLFILVSDYATNIARITGGPNIGNLFGAPGDLILLLGLLQKGFYSVTPVAETATITEPVRYPLEEGHSYLAGDLNTAFESFSELARSGRQGLLVTRTFPTDVRRDHDLQTTPIRWLAESKGQDVIPPEDLLGLSLMIKEFMVKATKPLVMVHGLEYLTTYNGFAPVLRLIQGISEENATRRGVLILPLLPGSLEKRDEVLLAAETTPLPAPHPSST